MNKKIEALISKARSLRREKAYSQIELVIEEMHNICDSNDHLTLGKISSFGGQIEHDQDHLEMASQFYDKAYDYIKKAGAQAGIAHALRHQADIHRELKLFDQAQAGYKEALRIYRSHSTTNVILIANTLRGMALLMEAKGKYDKAKVSWIEARALYAKSTIEEGIIECNQHIEKI